MLSRVLLPAASLASWLSQNACKDAREQETWATPLRTTIRRTPEKTREQFCAFGSRFGPSFGSVLLIRIAHVVPKTGPKTASKTGSKTRPNKNLDWHWSQQSTGLLPSMEELACVRNTMQFFFPEAACWSNLVSYRD